MSADQSSDTLASCVSSFRNRRVLVLGDVILDEYLFGECSRISPEAPVPVLKVSNSRNVPGGAANTAANIVSLGGHATLIALIGRDQAGTTLRSCVSDAGIDMQGIEHSHPTLRKTRVVGQQQQMLRLDYEATDLPDASTEAEVLRRFDRAVDVCDIVVISDYAKGFLTPTLAQTLIGKAHAAGKLVVVDPRPQNRECYRGCDYLTPNWKESRALLGLPEADPSPDVASSVAQQLAGNLGANVVLTLGANGILFCSSDGIERFSLPTMAQEVFDVSGAGDTVVAAFALALSAGADHATAVALANRAAGVVVGKFGTATVAADELLQDTRAHRLVSRRALAPLAAAQRAKGRRLVTVNGAFDVLHAGHLHILNEARQYGDVLIVGLNSDASVRSYKGPGRPILPEDQRAEMLLALRTVDFVHIFDEPDPIAFLREVRPDVHVNGSEYGENCIESQTVHDGGGHVRIVNRLPGLSTSGILEAAALRT